MSFLFVMMYRTKPLLSSADFRTEWVLNATRLHFVSYEDLFGLKDCPARGDMDARGGPQRLAQRSITLATRRGEAGQKTGNDRMNKVKINGISMSKRTIKFREFCCQTHFITSLT